MMPRFDFLDRERNDQSPPFSDWLASAPLITPLQSTVDDGLGYSIP